MNGKVKLNQSTRGFSLVEMAVVLVILGFVLGALLLPLQAQRQLLFQSQTENTLEIAKKALLGFAQSRGRLPCPATAASNGMEQPLGGATCAQQVGFLPAATLGIQPTDAQGFALDGWNNRIMYAVTQSNVAGVATPDYTTANDMANVGITTLSSAADNLRVCNSGLPATGITANTCSAAPETNYSINNAVAIIYSTGATTAQGLGGADETANLNDADANGIIDDGVFVSHGVTAASAAGGEFDHIVVWISPFVLYNVMIEAGQLH